MGAGINYLGRAIIVSQVFVGVITPRMNRGANKVLNGAGFWWKSWILEVFLKITCYFGGAGLLFATVNALLLRFYR